MKIIQLLRSDPKNLSGSGKESSTDMHQSSHARESLRMLRCPVVQGNQPGAVLFTKDTVIGLLEGRSRWSQGTAHRGPHTGVQHRT